MASGNGGQIALAKIGSLYSDVNTANIWTNFVSESLEHKLEEIVEGSISGRRDAPNSYKGKDYGDGDISFEPNPNVLGHFLKGWFGTIASSMITAAGSTGLNATVFSGAAQMYHKFVPNQSPFSDRTFLEPYNVLVYRDVGSAFLFKGVIFPTLKFEVKAKEIVKVTATIMARQSDRMERGAVASLVSSGGRPWLWDMASVEVSTTGTDSVSLAPRTDFEDVTMTLDLPHDGVSLLDGTKRYGEFTPSDFRSAKFEGTMSFRDQTAYDAFVAYEPRRLRMTFLNVNSTLILGNPSSADATNNQGYFMLRLHVPQLKFTSWSAPISGPNRLTAKFNAKAEYSESEGFSIMAELINIVSSAEYTSGK